jgi:hypothetical protein
MGANKFAGILAIIVIASTMTLAFVTDAASRKVKDLPISAVDKKADGSTWLASPEPLFDGNNMKLKPFLGSMSGAVALHYRGPKNLVTISIETWKDGMKTSTSGGMSMTLMDKEKDDQGNYQYDGDFVYSFQDRYDPNGMAYSELVYALTSQSGYASTAVRVEKPPGLHMWGEMKLQQNIKVPLDESTFVWGLQGTDNQQMSTYSSIAETLQNAKWAVAIRLGFNDYPILGPNETKTSS